MYQEGPCLLFDVVEWMIMNNVNVSSVRVRNNDKILFEICFYCRARRLVHVINFIAHCIVNIDHGQSG